MKIVLLSLGGALGALLRYYISKFVNSSFSFSYVPWGTVLVNVVGAFLLSFIIFTSQERYELPSNFILFFGSGLLGAFTTFSTFTYEALVLYIEVPLRGFIYFASNIVLGFLAAYLGMILGRGRLH
ncbi:fluoride efflux transporter FluC [Thermosipho atlanticus]|uniref:Fluoride-specific ion channel FluC n=1 Tax=Thermosipho atlanticus DSM 15807 TaxID=1123380 RepID=A0A1M5RYB9_9BACT|nr:CrcB family protein [Thermosipho atlanticus]SHH31181.1 camphor resistance protein CrcB [Thermosipho atlanticus DSM 15807]